MKHTHIKIFRCLASYRCHFNKISIYFYLCFYLISKNFSRLYWDKFTALIGTLPISCCNVLVWWGSVIRWHYFSLHPWLAPDLSSFGSRHLNHHRWCFEYKTPVFKKSNALKAPRLSLCSTHPQKQKRTNSVMC